MRTSNVLGAAFLGVGFAWVSFVMLFIEPDMGFTSPADFFDPEKVAAGYTSSVWLVSSIVYLAFPIAVMTIVQSEDDHLLRWTGAGAALLWLVVASVDRIGIQLPALLPSTDAVTAAVASTLPIRFAILKAAVAALGIFAWRTTRRGTVQGLWGRAWRGLGWATLALSAAFMFVFIPVPVVFTIWGFGLAVHYQLAPRRSGLGSVLP